MISFSEVWSVTQSISDQAMHPVEVEALYNLCCAVPENGLVVEVGCQLGRSSSVIAQVGKSVGYRSIHIDPYVEQPGFLTGWVELMYRLEHTFALFRMPTEKAAWHLTHYQNVDLAFIDGDHERPSVELDLQIVANKIKPGGMLLAHDYATTAHPGVAEAIDPYVSDGKWEHTGNAFTMGTWRRK